MRTRNGSYGRDRNIDVADLVPATDVLLDACEGVEELLRQAMHIMHDETRNLYAEAPEWPMKTVVQCITHLMNNMDFVKAFLHEHLRDVPLPEGARWTSRNDFVCIAIALSTQRRLQAMERRVPNWQEEPALHTSLVAAAAQI